MKNKLRYLWACFRWRFIASWMLIKWLAMALPMKDHPGGSRWQCAKLSWGWNRDWIMYEHEKDTDKYVTLEKFLEELTTDGTGDSTN